MILKNNWAFLDHLVLPLDEVSQTMQSVLCITSDKYLVRVLVVLLHARFSVVGPIPFLLAAFFFWSSLYRKYYRTSRYEQTIQNIATMTTTKILSTVLALIIRTFQLLERQI